MGVHDGGSSGRRYTRFRLRPPPARLPTDDQGFTIVRNLRHPVNERDAATKSWVEDLIEDESKKQKDEPSSPDDILRKENGEWDLQGLPLTSVGEPQKGSDATTKDFVETNCLTVNETAEWDCTNLPLVNVGVPTETDDTATKGFCEARFLQKKNQNSWDCQEMSLSNLKRPTSLKDAVNKVALDDALATTVAMDAGNFHARGLRIKHVGTPQKSIGAASMGWVLSRLPEEKPFFICEGHHNNEVDVEFDAALKSSGQFGISQDKKSLIVPEKGVWENTRLEHLKENENVIIEMKLTGVDMEIADGDKFIEKVSKKNKWSLVYFSRIVPLEKNATIGIAFKDNRQGAVGFDGDGFCRVIVKKYL